MALLEAATASEVWRSSLLESKKLLEALAAASAALDEASSNFRESAASEKENAARAVDLLWIGALWFGAWRARGCQRKQREKPHGYVTRRFQRLDRTNNH